MNFKKPLTMQLIPKQVHGRNLRSILNCSTWNNLSRAIRNRDKLCAHCDNKAEHCHEIWEWVVSEGKLIQRLVGLNGVCKDCHDFMHFGRVLACDGLQRIKTVLNHADSLVDYGESSEAYIQINLLAHQHISIFPLGKIDLKWLIQSPASVVGMSAEEFQPVWKELSRYLSDEEPDSVCVEMMKEDHAGEPN